MDDIKIFKFNLKSLKQHLYEEKTRKNQLRKETIFNNNLINEYFSWKLKSYV